MKKNSRKGTALDLIQALFMESHNPIVYCCMVLDSAIDVNRLRQAVRSTTEIIPQLLCGYNAVKNTWVPTGYDSNSIVHIVSKESGYDHLIWDLSTGPQMKISVYHQDAGDVLQIGISHIVTDGAGFHQYLALLCNFYNERDSQTVGETNSRSVLPLLAHTAVQRLTHLHKRVEKGNVTAILPVEQGQAHLHTLKVTLSEDQLKTVQEKARSLHVTLNDVFMASYAHALTSFTDQDEMILPCPADLRKFGGRNDRLTIANLTGKFFCRISSVKETGLRETALAVHQEMERQKKNYSCFHSIQILQIFHTILPVRLLRLIAKRSYSSEPTSYSNVGAVDHKNVFLHGVSITSCCLIGRYRQAPSFQVSISTYKNVCTLAVNISGTEGQSIAVMQILNHMKSVLLSEL